ncbi:MAG: hypothetical protein AVDCRST_MAG93-6881 [uncultured Chloroflexia bacterium]|uniref:Uncharacterized protein n=1 Tax=uncultured Chloroflexia bacterium TaxID=1672391 RepID=A0A6J4LZ79_9CHLR|nr:MAG: hypothetical protein AVDCRST_MAG93-6881 [uncultured Chloroflexia bacterium]
MERDDYVLCVYDDTYRYVARVIAKHENRQGAPPSSFSTGVGYPATGSPIGLPHPVTFLAGHQRELEVVFGLLRGRGARRAVGHRPSQERGGHVGSPESLRQRSPHVSVLQPLLEPLGQVVLDGGAASGRRRACRRRTGVPGSCRRICTR